MSNDTDIAVVGVGCRFPDAWTPHQFWSNIDDGVVSMRELPDELLTASGVDTDTLRSPDFVRVGTTLPGYADFAADFFGYTAREVRTMDPQQRIFLEVCWEALEHAGHPPRTGGPLVGVFAGSAAGNYFAAMFAAQVAKVGFADAVTDLDLHIGGEPDFLSTRVAYKLGLRGPALSVQTACSSSLYAAHYATLSLLSGECDIALAGGATVLEPVRGYRHRPSWGQSKDGLCRSFDSRSDGTNYSSGVGVVVLRRLSDALADGDAVLAVLRGTAVGNDGGHKAGYGAPSPGGVADVVAAALRVADVSPDLLRYVEAHGTATPLGDQVELAALTTALRAGTSRVGFCGLGSVKANIGHTGTTSSIAGFIKAVHIARTGVVPPHPTFSQPREPGLLAESPFYIPTAARACPDRDRHVLVNSIGFGGAAAAAVLAPPPAPTRPSAPTPDRVRLVLSARNRVELDEMSRNLADVLDAGELPIGDVAHTLRVGRKAFDERRVVTAPANQLAAALRLPRPPLVRSQRSTPTRAAIEVADGTRPELLARLRAALPDRTDGQAGFTIVVGRGESGPERHVLPPDADDNQLDAAVAAAWLHGVTVDWDRLARERGRRVPLPTYPFQRKRYWALDGVNLADLSARAAAAPSLPDTQDSVEQQVLAVWRDLFGDDEIGLDDQFGDQGGTSLLSVQLVLELQDRFGVLVNVHRAGGSRATVRRMTELVRGLVDGSDAAQSTMDQIGRADDELVDADLQLPIGPLAPKETRGKDFLLTGATGYLGAFLLHELLATTTNQVYCVVRAADEAEAWTRLRVTAAKFLLPEPDPARVIPVTGDLRDIAKLAVSYRDGELDRRVGHVLHCAARVAFTEEYRTIREDNVLPLVDLLTWSRGCGIRDFSLVSTAAATAAAMGSNGRVLETRDQALDPRLGGYGVSKWVGERLLDRADADGMRVRVFRPGLIMAAAATGAGNDKDLIYMTLASGIAVGAHPADDRIHAMAPVDVVARAIVGLATSPGSVGRAYHLVAEQPVTLTGLFALLADAGLPTRPVAPARWQDLVRERALATGNPLLATSALLEIEGSEPGSGIQATGWRSWLRRTGTDPAVTGEMLRGALDYLARHNTGFGELLADGVLR